MKAFFVSLSQKMLFANLLLMLIALGFVWLYVVPSYERQLESNRIESTQQAVDVTITMLDQIREQGIKRGVKESEVKARALTFLRGTRYNRFKTEQSIGYFWVHDLNAVMLMHPYTASLEGSNLSEFRDADNVRVFYDMNQLVKNRGAGTVKYNWPLPNGSEPQAKISYVRLYEPWGWVIGSGIYLDDILQQTKRLRFTLLAGSILVFSGCLILSSLLAARINKPYQALRRLSERIAGRISHEEDSAPYKTSDADLAISTMQRMLKEMEQAKDEAERANATKSRFLAMTGHDLRAPLANIAGLADLMLEEPEALTGYQQESVGLIASTAHNLLGQISDLLDLSKIEAGKFELYYTVADIDQLCDEILRLSDRQAAQKGIELRYQPDRTAVPPLFCDPVRIRQIITNLTGNAIKFTSSGYVAVTVSCTESHNGTGIPFPLPDGAITAELQIAVEDTGIGIPDEKLLRIFNAYEQVDRSTSFHFGGTGLGLAICSKLTQLMGGSIKVTSQPGKGSRFCVTLPVGMLPGASSTCLVDAEPLSCPSTPE